MNISFESFSQILKNIDLYINKVYGAKTHIYLSTTIHYTFDNNSLHYL